MTQWQVLWKVELPLAVPLILLGLQVTAIFVVATATIAAYIGLGGLGRYIIDGLASNNYGEVAGGAAVIVVLILAFGSNAGVAARHRSGSRRGGGADRRRRGYVPRAWASSAAIAISCS